MYPNDDLDYLAKNIVSTLFASERKRHAAQIDSLVERNNELKGKKYGAFISGNEVYYHSGIRDVPLRLVEKASLHITLIRAENAFKTNVMALQNDEAKIRQTVRQLIAKTSTIAEIKDALPDCLHFTLNKIFSRHPDLKLPREKEEAWTLLDSAGEPTRQYRQYMRTVGLIHSYVAMAMIN